MRGVLHFHKRVKQTNVRGSVQDMARVTASLSKPGSNCSASSTVFSPVAPDGNTSASSLLEISHHTSDSHGPESSVSIFSDITFSMGRVSISPCGFWTTMTPSCTLTSHNDSGVILVVVCSHVLCEQKRGG